MSRSNQTPAPRAVLALLLVLLSAALPAAAAVPAETDELEALLRVTAVVGREEPAAAFVASRLAGLPAVRDALGNVVLTFGAGEPRRLVACPLGEPGFAVTAIQDDGYLRLSPIGGAPADALWEQSHEGQVVTIGGARGLVPGAVAVRSVHLHQEAGGFPDHPFTAAEAYVDVGAESAAEVAELGIRLLDPVALVRRPVRLADGLLAGPAARQKGACAALLDAARRFRPVTETGGASGAGTVVFAWTTFDLLNGAGLAHVVGERGPFASALLLDGGFGRKEKEGAKAVWGATRIGYLGLPALYPGTPVEAVSPVEVQKLADAVLAALGSSPGPRAAAPPLPPTPPLAPSAEGAGEHAEEARLLGTLIARYGVSGAEAPVREEVLRQLPAWAHPRTDAQGNVTVALGPAAGRTRLFVAHLDEVGFRVAEILADGRLRLETRGGLLPSLWEAQAALVHGEKGPVPAVFEPRSDWRTAEHRAPRELTAAVGARSAAEAAALGIRVGSTVTMPKGMLRLGRHRVVGRSMDDRVGSTALLLALQRIDPAKLKRPLIFAWDVGEEVGLEGSAVLAKELRGVAEVHPVDTFVSADSPLESKQFANAPLGHGAVLRAMDNASLAPREQIDAALALAARGNIPLQVGFTGGATDGIPFIAGGAAMLPFSWPGRYSHSPVEVADLRDLEALVALIVKTALAP